MNRNADATQEFMGDAVPLLVTKDDKVAAARVQIDGGRKLCKFLIEKAQKAIALGDKNSAILLKTEAEAVWSMVKTKQAQVEAAEAERVGVLLQKKYPTFFERREIHMAAVALNKSDEAVLADKANLATANRTDWKAQKVNRNIAPARQGVDDMLSMGGDGNSVSAKSMCARHCQKDGIDVQGRSNCSYCHGAGFNAMNKIKEAGKHKQS